MIFDELCSSCFAEIASYPCPCCGYDPEKPAEESDALRVGTVLRERYSVGRVLASGAGAIDYAAMDLTDRTPLLLREYYPVSMAGRDIDGLTVLQLPSAKQAFLAGAGSFLREARTLRALRNVACLAAPSLDFLENRTVYAVYPYPAGRTLAEAVRADGPLSYKEAYRLFLPVLQALHACHARDLLHLAVRPDNLRFSSPGRLTLTGFSAAEYAVSPNPAETLRSAFSPPELQSEPGRVGPWSDVYGAAATLYFALTGLVPGPTSLPLCDCAVSLPLAASDLIQRVLTERDAESRVADMEILISGLTDAGDTEDELLVWRFASAGTRPVQPETAAANDVPPATQPEPSAGVSKSAAPAPSAVPEVPAEPQPDFAPNRADPVTRRNRRRRRRRTFLWIGLLCLLAAAAAVGLTFFLPKPQAAAQPLAAAAPVTVRQRWLGIQLDVPARFSSAEAAETLDLSSDAGVWLRFEFSASCGTALYGPDDVFAEPERFLAGYGALTGLADIVCGAPERVALPAGDAVRLNGACRRAGETVDFTLYALGTENGVGCLLVSVAARPGAEDAAAQADACVRSLELTGKTGSSVHVAENQALGIRFMYDGALLKNASDPMDGEVRLYLRAAPSQSVCICAPEPEARMTPEDYCAAQLTAIRTTLGNRLKEEEKRSVSGKLGDWNGASYRYDVDGEKFSLREEMFADRDGKLLNLYFYAGDGTSEALREAAELVMQSAEQLP